MIGGRPRDELTDLLVKEIKGENGERDHHQCQFCGTTFAQRNPDRIKKHAVLQCSAIPEGLKERVNVELASKAPGSKINSETGDWMVFGKKDDARHCPTCTCGMDKHEGGPMIEGDRERKHLLDYALTMFITVVGIPLAILDHPFTKNLFSVAAPWYMLPSASTFRDTILPRESTRVKLKTIAILKSATHLTSSFDGLTTPVSGISIYTHHATTPAGDSFLLEAHDNAGESHTAEFLHNQFRKDMETVGVGKFSAQCSDGAANVKLCRQMTAEKYPWIMNFSDPSHFLNLTAKQLAKVAPINKALKLAARITNHFSHASSNNRKLEDVQQDKRFKITRGLEAMGNTRFMTAYRCMRSVQRCMPALQFAVQRGILDLKAAVTAKITDPQTKTVENVKTNLNAVLHPESTECAQFISQLDFAVAVLQPLHFALTILEAQATTAADVFIQWMHIMRIFQTRFGENATTRQWRDQYPEACAEVLIHLNNQFRKGVYDENLDQVNIFRDAVYLHPTYHGSALLRSDQATSNKIAASLITLWRDHKLASVPEGHTIGRETVNHFLHQLQLFHHHQAPYNQRFHRGPNAETPLDWWTRLRRLHPHTNELADLAIKIFSVKPSSLPEERWGSAMSWIMPGRRGSMRADTLIHLLRCRSYFLFTQPGRGQLQHFKLDDEKLRADVLPNGISTGTILAPRSSVDAELGESAPDAASGTLIDDSVDIMFPRIETIVAAITNTAGQTLDAAHFASLDHPHLAALSSRMLHAEPLTDASAQSVSTPDQPQAVDRGSPIDPRHLDLSYIMMPGPPPSSL
jgi:hypothetical protein